MSTKDTSELVVGIISFITSSYRKTETKLFLSVITARHKVRLSWKLKGRFGEVGEPLDGLDKSISQTFRCSLSNLTLKRSNQAVNSTSPSESHKRESNKALMVEHQLQAGNSRFLCRFLSVNVFILIVNSVNLKLNKFHDINNFLVSFTLISDLFMLLTTFFLR